MKAKFFLLGLCALALASCSIDEVSRTNDSNAIQFKATASTRAEATTTNNINEFTVWAWNGDNLFMDGVTATKSGSVFTTSPLYFWPTGSVDFYALTEVVEHGIFTDGDSQQHEYALLGGQIDVTGDWTYTGNVAKAQVDNGTIKIDACIPSTPEEQIDICYGVALEKSSGSVPMNFRHALSQVAFKAKNVNTAFDVKIADVSVCSVYSEGTYTISNNDTSDNLKTSDIGTGGISSSQGEWAITEEDDSGVAIKSRYLVNLENSIVQLDTLGTVEELVDPNGTLMLLPQEIVGWVPLTDANDDDLGGYIRILCHVEEHGSQLWPNGNEENTSSDENSSLKEINGEEYAEIAIPLEDIEWEQGYRYTYTIIFGEGLGYYPPDDPNYDLDGTPVLVPITFKVTVDEFQDAEATKEGQFDIETEVDLSEITVTSAAELVGAARMGYEVINVEESITLENVYVEFTQDCVLNIADGATITATNAENGTDYPSINGYTNYTAAILVTGGTLTINGGTVTTTGDSDAAYTEAIWVDGGTVIINGGTFKGGSWNDDSTTDSESAVFVEHGAAYIYGGTFSSGYYKTWCYVLNCMDSPRKAGEAWIYVYGGTYENFDPSNCHSEGEGTNFCADANGENITGYSIYDEDTNTYTVHQRTTVTSLADINALINADTDDMITIAEDVALTGTFQDNHAVRILSNQKNINICIEEGATLTVTASADNTDYAGIYLGAGTVTVNLYGDGELRFDANGHEGCGFYPLWVQGLGSTLNIYGGDYEGYNCPDAVYVVLGTANVYGGTFGADSTYNDEYWLLNCEDANYKNGSAFINTYGGKFYMFDPGNCVSEGQGTNFLGCKEDGTQDDYVSTFDEDTGYYTVTAK